MHIGIPGELHLGHLIAICRRFLHILDVFELAEQRTMMLMIARGSAIVTGSEHPMLDRCELTHLLLELIPDVCRDNSGATRDALDIEE